LKLLALVLLLFYLLKTPAGCNDKNIQPAFPPKLTDAQRQKLDTKWKAGEVLFKKNCSHCHGVFTKGKDSIPNFTKVQIDMYTTRFLNRDKKNHAVMLQLSTDDFNNILTFLIYLKRDKPVGPPVRNMQRGFQR
jgi:cytochrome c553